LDFGSCSNPTIKFANGLDGRNQPAFAPVNAADFNHGSALNIGVIASFICGQLQSACKASQGMLLAGLMGFVRFTCMVQTRSRLAMLVNWLLPSFQAKRQRTPLTML
jgi:hypothetical protein